MINFNYNLQLNLFISIMLLYLLLLTYGYIDYKNKNKRFFCRSVCAFLLSTFRQLNKPNGNIELQSHKKIKPIQNIYIRCSGRAH